MLVKTIHLRNKLHFLGYHDAPKDPFTDIEELMFAVGKFQEDHGLPSTGFLDVPTISSIEQESDAKLASGKSSQSHYLPKHFRSKLDELQPTHQTPLHALDYVGQNINVTRVRHLWTGRKAIKAADSDPFKETPTAFRVFRGITQLVSRPMERSKEEGVSGFMKGIKEGFLR
jgi:hypothetical protein